MMCELDDMKRLAIASDVLKLCTTTLAWDENDERDVARVGLMIRSSGERGSRRAPDLGTQEGNRALME